MVRIGLATYLMLVTLAAPSFCPCKLTQLLAKIAHPAHGGSSSALPDSGSCCRHRAPLKDQRKQSLPDCPYCPAQDCPCRQHQSQLIALVSPDAESARHYQQWRFLGEPAEMIGLIPAPLELSLTRLSQATGENAGWPLLSARYILYHLHILRC